MALPATDTFTGTDGTNLTTYSSSWTYNDASQSMTATIQSNSLQPGNGGSMTNLAHWNADTFSNDQYAEAVVSSVANGTWAGVSVRAATGSTTTAYNVNTDFSSASLSKIVAGTETNIASASIAAALNDVIRLEAQGTSITALRNGAAWSGIGTQTDNSIASGNAGVNWYGTGTTRIDNWEGGDLGGGAINLTIAEATHGHTVDAPAFTQVHSLAIQETTHGHLADAPAFTQDHILVIQEANHGHLADAPSFTQVHILTVQEANHGHLADAPTFTQVHNLIIQETYHGHLADAPDPNASINLVIEAALHAHTAGAPALSQVHILIIQDAYHGHVADGPSTSARLRRRRGLLLPI